MGQAQSNNNSSEVDTLNWSDVNTEAMTEGYRVTKDKNGIEDLYKAKQYLDKLISLNEVLEK